MYFNIGIHCNFKKINIEFILILFKPRLSFTKCKSNKISNYNIVYKLI